MRKSDLRSMAFKRSEEFPEAVDKNKIGSYPHDVEFGGGVYYDEVLEYRVWAVSSLRSNYLTEILPDSNENEGDGREDEENREEGGFNGEVTPEESIEEEINETIEDKLYCFPSYPEALEFFEVHDDCDEPVALVLQREYIDNAHENFLVHVKKTRMVEWDVELLLDHRRSETSIREYFCGKSPANAPPNSENQSIYGLNSVNEYLEARNVPKSANLEPEKNSGQLISEFLSDFAPDEDLDDSLGEFLQTAQSIRLSYMTRKMLNYTNFHFIGGAIGLATVMFFIVGGLFASLFPSSLGFVTNIIVFLLFLAFSLFYIFGQFAFNGEFFIISPHKIDVYRYLRRDPVLVIEKQDIRSIRYCCVIPSREFILKHNVTGNAALPDVSVAITLQNGQKKVLDVAHAFTYDKELITRYYRLLEGFMKCHYSAQSNQECE